MTNKTHSMVSEKKLLYRVQAHKDAEAFGRLYDTYIEKIPLNLYFLTMKAYPPSFLKKMKTKSKVFSVCAFF